MGTSAAAPRVLVIGLDPYRAPGPWEPKPVADGIEVGLARFAEHGVSVETGLFGLDGSDDVEAVVTAALPRPTVGSASLPVAVCGMTAICSSG